MDIGEVKAMSKERQIENLLLVIIAKKTRGEIAEYRFFPSFQTTDNVL